MLYNTQLKITSAMLFGVAIGDALGVPVEFSNRQDLKAQPVVSMRSGGTWEQPAGTWSDDTSMTLATMAAIAQDGYINCESIMTNFINWYQRDMFICGELFDIGKTTSKALNRYIHGSSAIDSGLTDPNSNGNGSLMRIAPIGLYLYSKHGLSLSSKDMTSIHEVSSLTHAHPISKMCCGVYCLIMLELLVGKPVKQAVKNGLDWAYTYYESRSEFKGLWAKHIARLADKNFKDTPEDEIISSGYVVSSLESAIWCLLNTSDYSSAVLKAVNLGRDTDTIGAITGGLAGITYGVDSIPTEWVNKLRRKDYLLKVATKFSKVL